MERSRLRVTDDITQLVGETPMLQFRRLVPAGSAEIYAKLEYLNPGGSVKDRAAIGIIRRAEEEGSLKPGGTIVEATEETQGSAWRLSESIAAIRSLCLSRNIFPKKKSRSCGLLARRSLRTPDADGMLGAIAKAKEFAASNPGSFMAGQFENPANPDYHYETTAVEIFEQMEGRIDAVVIGSGTAGTFTGVARYLKERLPRVLAYVVETQGSVLGGGKPGKHKVEGIGASFIPKEFRPLRVRRSNYGK